MPRARSKRPITNKKEPIAKNIKVDLEQKVTLPDELWLKIMCYLKTKDLFLKVALVCKHFYNLALDGGAVKCLEVRKIPSKKVLLKIMEILKRSKSLTGLNINLNLLDDKNKRQKKFFFNDLLVQALTSKRKLKSLDIKLSNYKDAELLHDTLTCLNQNGMELEHLQLDGLKGPYIFDIFKSIINLENLRSLTLRPKYSYAKPNDLISFAKNCKKLEILKINFKNYIGNALVDTESLVLAFDTFFMERQSTLRCLVVENILVNFGGRDMLKNLDLCQKLEELELSGSPNITQSSLNKISTLPHLKKLVFRNLNTHPAIFQSFLARLNKENLECLVISRCPSFNEFIFRNIMSNICFPKLERVFIGCKHTFDAYDFNHVIEYQVTMQCIQKLNIECIIEEMINKSPRIKSIMLEVELLGLKVSDNFCLKMSKKYNVLLSWLDEPNQSKLEQFLRSNDVVHFEKYMTMKNDLTEWCINNDFEFAR